MPNDGRQTGTRRVLITDRDAEAIRWVGEMYAVRRDLLRFVLAPHSVDPLTLGRAGEIVARWKALGLVESSRLQHAHPEWVWLTTRGMAAAGLDFDAVPPQPIVLAHTFDVARVRVAMQRAGWSDGWIGERSLLRDKPDGRAHTPDGVMVAPDQVRWAVELERTQKSERRLGRIVTELLTRAVACSNAEPMPDRPGWWWHRVLYVTTNSGSAGAVRRAVERLPTHLQPLVDVRSIAEFPL